MKKPILCLMFISIVACTSEGESIHIEKSHERYHDEVLRSADNPAGNTANPYDLAGQVHDELFLQYYALSTPLQTINGIATDIEWLASGCANFRSLDGAGDARTTSDKLASWTGHENCAVDDVITSSNVSALAKSRLRTFTDSIISMNVRVNEYDSIYNYIELYESNVLQDPLLSANDRQHLLTVSSISRFVTYRQKKKPKKNTDPDWDLMILSLAGSIDGAERSPAESVVNALTAGIMQNK